MASRDFAMLTLQLSVMLGSALLCGQILRRFRQPAVVGEMAAGILIGVTVLGSIAPDFYEWLFRSSANAAVVRDASIKLGMLFFLYIAGSEVDLSDLRRLGRRAGSIGLVGTVIPILVGVGIVYALPHNFWGDTAQAHFFPFALFIGMNLANSANPVLARILIDLGMLRGGIGTLSMTATIVDDLVNWTLFAFILHSIAPSTSTSVISDNLALSIGLIFLLFVVVLGGGRWLAPRLLPRLKARLGSSNGTIAVIALFILLTGSLAEGLGVHAFLGAFLLGVAFGGDHEDRREAHRTITQFALWFFAPIYFISIGMNADFIANFDVALVMLVIAVALVSKLGGVLLGARLAGMPLDREAWAIAWGLNARGATGIILAGVGRSVGVIDDRIFVAIVTMALFTSLIAGPIMRWLLARHIVETRILAPSPTIPTSPIPPVPSRRPGNHPGLFNVLSCESTRMSCEGVTRPLAALLPRRS